MAWPETIVTPPVPTVQRVAWGPLATDTPIFSTYRHFVAGDEITFAAGAADDFDVWGGAQGLDLVMCLRITAAPTGNASLIRGLESGGPWILGVREDGRILGGLNPGVTSSGSTIPFEHWCVLAMTDDGVYCYDLEEGKYTALGASFTSPGAWSPLSLQGLALGGTPTAANAGVAFDLAAAGVWGRTLQGAEVKDLVEAESLEDWKEVGVTSFGKNVALWLMNQTGSEEKVLDITGGGADEEVRDDTEVIVGFPPIPYGDVVVKEVIEVGSKPPTVGQLFPRGM